MRVVTSPPIMSSMDRWNGYPSSDIEEGEIIEDNNESPRYQFCVPSDADNNRANHNNKRSFDEINNDNYSNCSNYNEPSPKRQKVSSQITTLYPTPPLDETLYINSSGK